MIIGLTKESLFNRRLDLIHLML